MGQRSSQVKEVKEVKAVNEVKTAKVDHPQVFLEQHLLPPLAQLCVEATGWSRGYELARRAWLVKQANQAAQAAKVQAAEATRLAEERRMIPIRIARILENITSAADQGQHYLSLYKSELGAFPDEVIHALEAEGLIVKWCEMLTSYEVRLPHFVPE